MEDVYTQEAKVETKEALDIATQDVVDVDAQGIISLATQGIMDWASYGTKDMVAPGTTCMAEQGIMDLVVIGTTNFPYNQSGRMESNFVLVWLLVFFMRILVFFRESQSLPESLVVPTSFITIMLGIWVIARKTCQFCCILSSTHEIFWSTLKLEKIILIFKKNMVNV
jgi:hypothetical protein